MDPTNPSDLYFKSSKEVLNKHNFKRLSFSQKPSNLNNNLLFHNEKDSKYKDYVLNVVPDRCIRGKTRENTIIVKIPIIFKMGLSDEHSNDLPKIKKINDRLFNKKLNVNKISDGEISEKTDSSCSVTFKKEYKPIMLIKEDRDFFSEKFLNGKDYNNREQRRPSLGCSRKSSKSISLSKHSHEKNNGKNNPSFKINNISESRIIVNSESENEVEDITEQKESKIRESSKNVFNLLVNIRKEGDNKKKI